MPHAFGTDYAGIALWKMALPAVIVPWIFVFQLLDREDFTPPWSRVLRGIAFFVCMMVVFDRRICTWTGIPRAILFGIILISGWAFFLPILRHVCMQGQLTGRNLCEEA